MLRFVVNNKSNRMRYNFNTNLGFTLACNRAQIKILSVNMREDLDVCNFCVCFFFQFSSIMITLVF